MTGTRTDLDWRADRLGTARRGENPTVLRRMPTGWAVIGDFQRLPGYCVLLHDGDADQLTDLQHVDQVAFLADLAVLGQAVAAASATLDPAFTRVNYEVLGNAYHHLHGHVRARYAWEPDRYRRSPACLYPDLEDESHRLDATHQPLRTALEQALDRLL